MLSCRLKPQTLIFVPDPYSEGHFLELVHGRKLFEARHDCVVQRPIRGHSGCGYPRVACATARVDTVVSSHPIPSNPTQPTPPSSLLTQNLVCGGAFLGVGGEHFPDEVLGALRDLGPGGGLEIDFPFQHRRENALLRLWTGGGRRGGGCVRGTDTSPSKVLILHSSHPPQGEAVESGRSVSPPQNGGTPDSRMYRMTPALHTSISGPYLRWSTSGAT